MVTDYANRRVLRAAAINRDASGRKQNRSQAQSTQPWRDSFERIRQYFVLTSGRPRWPRPRFDRSHRQPVSTVFGSFRSATALKVPSRAGRTGSGLLPSVLFRFHFFLRGNRRSLIHVIFFSHDFRFLNFYLFGADASLTVLISSAPAFLKMSFARSTSSLSSAWTAIK